MRVQTRACNEVLYTKKTLTQEQFFKKLLIVRNLVKNLSILPNPTPVGLR